MFLILIMTLFGAVASIFFKKASASRSFLMLLTNKNLYIGGILYLMAAICNILVLKRMNYSVVLPLTSLTYIWTMLLSKRLLNEKITKHKIVGVLCILLGAVLIVL